MLLWGGTMLSGEVGGHEQCGKSAGIAWAFSAASGA